MRKQLVLLLLPLMTVGSGCAGTSIREKWAGMIPGHAAREARLAEVDPDQPKTELSKEFRAAQKMFDNPERVLVSYARMKEDNEEYAEARLKYRELTMAYPNNVEAHLGLARIELATGRSEQAQAILMKLAERHPQNATVFMEYGRLYASQDKWPEAILQFQKASELIPGDQNARYELGLAYIGVNRLDDALSHLKFAVGEPAAMYNIGYVLQERGRTAEAIPWFRRALENHPDERTAHQSQQMLAKLTQPDGGNEGLSSNMASWNGNTRPGGIRTRARSSSAISSSESNAQATNPVVRRDTSSATGSSSPGFPAGGAARFENSSHHADAPAVISSGFRTASFSSSSSENAAPAGNASWSTPPVLPASGNAVIENGPNQLPQWNGPSSGQSAVSVGGGFNAGVGERGDLRNPPDWQRRR